MVKQHVSHSLRTKVKDNQRIYSVWAVYITLFGPNEKQMRIQSNLDGSNTDGSFTMANSGSFLSPYEILPIAQENKYLGKFSYFITKLYVVCTH